VYLEPSSARFQQGSMPEHLTSKPSIHERLDTVSILVADTKAVTKGRGGKGQGGGGEVEVEVEARPSKIGEDQAAEIRGQRSEEPQTPLTL
jgi:hypothetical protein